MSTHNIRFPWRNKISILLVEKSVFSKATYSNSETVIFQCFYFVYEYVLSCVCVCACVRVCVCVLVHAMHICAHMHMCMFFKIHS